MPQIQYQAKYIMNDYAKDHAGILFNAKCISQLEQAHLICSIRVKQLDSWIKRDRVVAMTPHALFFFKGDNFRSRMSFLTLAAITLSYHSDEIVIHSHDTPDIRLKCAEQERDDFLKNLLNIYSHQNTNTQQGLKVFFIEDKNLEAMAHRKKETKLPTCNYQMITGKDWAQRVLPSSDPIHDECLYARPCKKQEIKCTEFKVLNQIAKSSVSRIFLVEWVRQEKLMVMKQLKKDLLEQIGRVDRINTNLALQRHRSSPFLEQLEFAFETDTSYLLLFKFYPRADLYFRLQAEKHFEEEDAKYYFCQLACILGGLHEKGQTYKDLTLENVLIDDNGYLLLTDYGLARGVSFQPGLDGLLVTPEYTPPEALKDQTRKEHSRMADWWALGMCLYEMLYGLPPFIHTDPQMMYSFILRADPYRVPQIRITDDCWNMVLSLLQKDPAHRLGKHTDLPDIKNHPWVKQQDWDSIKNRRSGQSRTQSLTQSMMTKSHRNDHLDTLKHDTGSLLENIDQKMVRQSTLDFSY